MAGTKVHVHKTDEGRKSARKAGLAAAAILPLVSACGAALHAEEPVRQAESMLADEGCRISGSTVEYEEGGRTVKRDDVLEFMERPLAIACPYDEVTVLTRRSLIIIYRDNEGEREDGVSISLDSSRTDMTGILGPGFVDWAQSPDTVYILTLDGRLTLVPKNDMGDTIAVYSMGFDVRDAEMTYSEGFELIANNAGQIVVMRATEEGATRAVLELPDRLKALTGGENLDFFISGGRLCYGREGGENVGIIISGPRVLDVRLE